MKTYVIHHTPTSAHQDTWAIAITVPFIARQYARTGDGIWYVQTWLSAEQIKRRLEILFDDFDQLHVHELGRDEASLNTRVRWTPGRLEDEEPMEFSASPRALWQAVQAAFSARPRVTVPPAFMVASSGNSRAA